MNRNVNRSYELESPYQFINPAHSFLMESVHEQHDFFDSCFAKDAELYLSWIPARGIKTRRAQDKINRRSKGV